MSRSLFVWVALAAALLGVASGYHAGAGSWPFAKKPTSIHATSQPTQMVERKVLYWKHPDGVPDYSPAPKKSDDGREYLPVYDEEEKSIAGAEPKTASTGVKGKLLYYRNPMGLADTSPVPKKDWMGMDYIPVYEGEDQGGSTVKVSLDRVQRAGVRSEPVASRVLARLVRAPGIAKPDERTLRSVSLRSDGFIEKLYVDQTGQHVDNGAAMFRVYSPQLVAVQTDYLVALSTGNRDQRGPLQRLKNLAMPAAAIEEMQRTRAQVLSMDWPSPINGVVLDKKVIQGQMAKAGEELYRLADLSSIWVIADVSEQDLGQVRVGEPARISFKAFPGESFKGSVTFILHELDAATRTGKVRIEVANPDHRIKHEMFADVVIDTGAGSAARLAVPASAVIDSGNRQVAIIDKGQGLFEPRAIKIGARSDGFVEVLEGVKEGEAVVVAANFLIDAESNLKAALAGFTAEQAAKQEGKP